MKSIKSVLIVSITLYSRSCKKNSTPTTMELLTRAPWKTIEETRNPDNNGWYDFWATLPDCWKDNTIKYNLDLSAILDQGPLKCNPSGPQTTTGTWFLYPSCDKYSVTMSGKTVDYDILELNEDTLKLYFKITNATSMAEYKATMIH